MSVQRVYVTTHKADGLYPWFRVHPSVSDKFIDETVLMKYGARADGTPHEWEAFDETPELLEAAAADGAAAG